jgi:hypothetical protein
MTILLTYNIYLSTNVFSLQNALSLTDLSLDHKCGLVLMLHGGIWGAVCGDYFDDEEAAVVCRQLGLKGGRRRQKHTQDSRSYIPTTWMDSFRCSGAEMSLEDCDVTIKDTQCHSGGAVVCCNEEVR